MKTGGAKLHFLPLENVKKSAIASKQKSESPSDEEKHFANLATRLEDRMDKIENDLKSSLGQFEHDLHALIKAKKVLKNDTEIKTDLHQLTQTLETRMQKTLGLLMNSAKKNKKETERLEGIKKLSSELIKVLSFDFYKGVIESLRTADDVEEVDPFGMDRHLVEKVKPLFDFLYFKYWRIKTTGIENIPDDGRALIVANHSGTVPYDGAMIKTAILNEHPKRKDARFLVEDFVYHMPFMGNFMYRIGGVRACPENAKFLLNAGHLVVVFPEGVKGIGKYYGDRYQLQRFGRGGFIKLCMNTKSPLVPVGIVGAEEIHPILYKSNVLAKAIGLPYIPITPTFPLLGLLGIIPFPTKWSMHFGKPITFDHLPASTIEDELQIHKLSEKVRGEIQQIIVQLLQKRKSVLFG